MREAYAKRNPPTYAELTSQLYDRDPNERYALARLMVDQLLGRRSHAAIAPLLEEARRLQDFAAAMSSSCKASGPEVRAAVLKDLGLTVDETPRSPPPKR